MTLEIKKQPTKEHSVFIRINNDLFTKIRILEKRHKVDRSTVIRRLIEEGLKNA